MIKAIIFDIGNTLVYYTSSQSAKDTVDAIGCLFGVAPKSKGEVMHWMRFELNKTSRNFKEFAEHYLKKNRIKATKKNVAGICAIMEKRGKSKSYKETIPTLKELSKKFILAAVSNMDKPGAKRLRKMPFIKEFRFVIFSCDVFAVKPEREIYISTAKKLGLKPSECIWVGDTLDADYYGPIKYGFNAVLLNREKKKMPKNVGQIKSLTDLSAFLQKKYGQ